MPAVPRAGWCRQARGGGCDILGHLLVLCSTISQSSCGTPGAGHCGSLLAGLMGGRYQPCLHMLGLCALSCIVTQGSGCLQLSEEQRAALKLEIGICGVTREDEEDLEVSLRLVLVDHDVPLGWWAACPCLSILHEKSLSELGHDHLQSQPWSCWLSLMLTLACPQWLLIPCMWPTSHGKLELSALQTWCLLVA